MFTTSNRIEIIIVGTYLSTFNLDWDFTLLKISIRISEITCSLISEISGGVKLGINLSSSPDLRHN